MAKIVAIGGGDLREKTTLAIDQEIVRFSGKKKPKVLFIPTASSDAEGYYFGVKEYFGNLGCEVDVLYLIREKPTKQEIESKILGSDIIYVGGGNTLKMMMLWRKMGVDTILEKALKKDIVLCGLSAGSICWFDSGNSDSRKFTSNTSKLIKVTGLGFLKAIHCPHYDVETHRQEDLMRMMKRSSLVAIALDNDCAIQIQDGEYRILSSRKTAKAYKAFWKKGQYIKEEILQSERFAPISTLLAK